MSNEKYLDSETFEDMLKSCKNAISNNDIAGITTLMEEYVDGFSYEK